jgi:NAD(P)-dependent dehydrogenase (short-subunit alcohol dehydrogenase family)
MPTNPIFSLENKRVLITGGGSGLGLATARCMVLSGAEVIITGRREAVLREAVADLNTSSVGDQDGTGRAHYIVNDVSKLDGLEELVDQIYSEFGPIDCLINNAGINLKKPALAVTDADFDRIIQTNLSAVFALTRACAKRMITRKTGSITMISSMAAYYGIDRVVAYAASKAGIEGMVRVLASEFSPHNVRVNALAPGFIKTAMSAAAMNSDPDRRDRAMRRTPMGDFGHPDDVGWAAVFLASDAARYITGISLPVDGGNSIGF